MFELSIAWKYLRPRWRQLSVSIISLISILVIALVVWLIVVFFSVTHGLEKSWIQKLIALTAPIRITPTEEYYRSYYYLVDSISAKSDYAIKSIGEKLNAEVTDPYNPKVDEEIPANWMQPLRTAEGSIKDIVKVTFQAIKGLQNVPELTAQDYEMTGSNLRLRLLRTSSDTYHFGAPYSQAFLSQAAYLGSFDPANPSLSHTLLAPSMDDLQNIYTMLSIDSENIQEDSPDSVGHFQPLIAQKKLRTFFEFVQIEALKTSKQGWNLPRNLVPKQGELAVGLVKKDQHLLRIIIPQKNVDTEKWSAALLQEGLKVEPAKLLFQEEGISILENGNKRPLPGNIPLLVEGNVSLPAQLVPSSLNYAKQGKDVVFTVKLNLQGFSLEGEIPKGRLEIAKAKIQETFDTPPLMQPFWLYKVGTRFVLPSDAEMGEAVLLPKTFREAGILLGDRGYVSYYTPTASTVQEQRVPIFIAGFYDPGIIPIGGKYLIANSQIVSLIRSAHSEDSSLSNGINVRFDHPENADQVKAALLEAFRQEGIQPYWKIETYREFEFTKDLIQQLRSDRNLFSLIATVIIIVACSNIISMLIILVNDKKLEIGILRSMGATSGSIAAIFGICGVVMGVAGSAIGTLAALLTLKNLDLLVKLLSKLQGYDAFNPVFYGDALPREISLEALLFVIAATGVISLLAGIVPAVKACLLRPSAILRAE